MRRRTLISALGSTAAAWPLEARTQQAAGSARIGVLSPFAPAAAVTWHEALRGGLRDLGWIEGSNISIEYRYANGDTGRLPGLATDILRLKVNVIVTEASEASVAAQKATAVVPIVIVAVGDPVAVGLVSSLARPGGNVTGLSQNIVESAGKRLEMLKVVMPELTDAAVLWNPNEKYSVLNWREVQLAARQLGIRLQSLETRDLDALDKVLNGEVEAPVRALYIVPGPLFVTNLKRIADFAAKRRLGSIFFLSEFVHLGGLLAYGPDRKDQFRRAAAYVDKILKGARPVDSR